MSFQHGPGSSLPSGWLSFCRCFHKSFGLWMVCSLELEAWPWHGVCGERQQVQAKALREAPESRNHKPGLRPEIGKALYDKEEDRVRRKGCVGRGGPAVERHHLRLARLDPQDERVVCAGNRPHAGSGASG